MSITNYPDADFTPDIPNSGANTGKQSYNPTGSFRFWAQKVLPTVYDDSLSYYEILTKVVNYLNAVIQNVDSLNDSVDNTNSAFDTLQGYVNDTKDTIISAYNELQEYVNSYFDSLDVQEEINAKLDVMASDGSLSELLAPFIPSLVSDWLSENITPTSPAIDASLSISGAGADAKVTGEQIADVKSALQDESGMASALNMNVYNENLLPGSNIWNGNWKTAQTLINKWAPNGTYMGFVVMERTGTYNGLYQNVSVEANKKYTFEAFVKVSSAQNVNIVIGNASSSDGTTATTNVKSKAFSVSANQWTRILLTFECSASGIIAPRIENTASATISVCGYVLYEGYPVTRVGEIIDAYPSLMKTTEEFNDMIYPKVNMLENELITGGKIYKRGTVTAETNEAGQIIRFIPIKEGITYYYRNIWAYFSAIKYYDDTIVSLSDDTTTLKSGIFTALKNGILAITVGKTRTNSNILLTTNESLYNSGSFSTEYVPKKLRVPKVYRVEKDGSGDFDNLIEAITEAEKHIDSIVYVGEGTWNVIEEMGDDFENISMNNRGIYLKNRIHLIFASNSKWVCNYTGTTPSVIAWGCIFNSGKYGFTIENATLEGSNIRYLVHDERDSDTDSYVNKYINCRFLLDNSQSTSETHQCIGGGLGLCGYIEIDGCYFKSVIDTAKNVMFYHNSVAADGGAKSHIVVKNCYAYGLGRFGFHWYGNSQLVTEVEVSGCSYGAPLHIAPETESAPYENVHVTEWNNIIRT